VIALIVYVPSSMVNEYLPSASVTVESVPSICIVAFDITSPVEPFLTVPKIEVNCGGTTSLAQRKPMR